ncbi:unnamed protein product [Sphagnum balticum]
MVIAAVAARTRAAFYRLGYDSFKQSCVKSQQWLLQALHMQGKLTEADEELQKLVHMHATFSPDPNSAEMELVARGLSYLGAEERRELLIMYTAVGAVKL